MITDRATLPPNVRRWLDRSLSADAPAPNRILNTQEGEMDIRGKWTPFTAQTTYGTGPFSFLWKARFSMMPGVWLAAEDGHNGERGWGGSKLWGFIPMGGRQGPEVFAMQLVRSLSELPWIPQFALALPNLEWQDSGDNRFEVRVGVGKKSISVIFDLNHDDEIVRASSKRSYDVPEGFVEVPWHYDFTDYCDHDGVHVPDSAIAVYDKPDGDWVYWRGKITSITSEF